MDTLWDGHTSDNMHGLSDGCCSSLGSPERRLRRSVVGRKFTGVPVEGEEGSKSDQGEELQGRPQRLSQLMLNSPSEWPHIEVKHPDILYPCFHLLANPEGCHCERGRSVCRSVP